MRYIKKWGNYIQKIRKKPDVNPPKIYLSQKMNENAGK